MLAAFSVIVALFAPAAPAAADPNALWREADALDHRDHDYAKAIALYGRIVTEFPAARIERVADSRRQYLVRGVAGGEEPLRRFEIVRETYATSDRAKAAAEVEAIVREFPSFPLHDELLLWLGDRATEAKRWDDARRRYQALLDQHPESPQRGFALGGLAHAAFESGDYATAERAYSAIGASGIPGAAQVSESEVEMVRRHVARRHGLAVALGFLLAVAAAAVATVDPRRLRGAVRAAFGRELLYVAPLLGIVVVIAPSDGRADLAAIAGASLAFLILALVWAEAARPALSRPLARAASAALATLAGAAMLYVVMYARDVLVAVERVV